MIKTVAIRAPACDIRAYRSIRLSNGVKILLVQDSEAVFAAAAVSVHAGYLDDSVHGLAHMLEHAVHLGSNKYPCAKEYKAYLSSHGGTSNASTSICHTQFHFTVLDEHLQGAIDRLSRFFIDPLLGQEDVLAEVENVHAEYSRNGNSDDRKLLQLKRSSMGSPYSSFSTGNLTTLRDGPREGNQSLHLLVGDYWKSRYTGGTIMGCIVSSHPLDTLEQWASACFCDVRPSSEDKVEQEEGWRRWMRDKQDPSRFARQVAPLKSMGLLYRIRPKRDLRQIEIRWLIPYGSMLDSESKPWRLVGHLLGHEAEGSLAYELKRKMGSIQSLSVAIGDEVRSRIDEITNGLSSPSSGFVFYSLAMSLTEKGEASILSADGSGLKLMLQSISQALGLIRDLGAEDWGRIHQEVQSLTSTKFEFQDRSQPLDLAKECANRLHYFLEEEVLSGPVLLGELDIAAVDRFLSHLKPSSMNVYLSSRNHPAGSTPLTEEWYKAEYGVQEFDGSLLSDLESGGIQLDLHVPKSNWALPLDISLVLSPSESAAKGSEAVVVSTSRHSSWTPPDLIELDGPVADVGTVHIKVWHKADISLEVPKGHVYVHLATPLSYLSSHEDYICCRIYCKLIDDLLEPSVYFAELAGSSYSLSCSDAGLVLHFSGFSSVVKKLVDSVVTGMKVLSLDQINERFDVVKGRLVQQWRLWEKNNPLSHCDHYCDHLLTDPSYLVSDSLRILEGGEIGPDRIIEWRRKMFQGSMQINMLSYGNFDEGDARGLASKIRSCFEPRGLDPLPQPFILQLPPAQSVDGGLLVYRPKNPNPSNSNSAIILVSEIGVGENHPATCTADVKTSVLASLLVKVASKPCFHSLRTVQRLGYTVQLTLNKMDQVLYLHIRVQSPDKATDLLRDRALAWLKDYRSELVDLSSDQFESFKASLMEHYLEPPRSLAAAASRAWAPIRSGTVDWQGRVLKAECVKGVTLDQLVEFYDQHILPTWPESLRPSSLISARLCVEIQSGKTSAVDESASKRQKTGLIESDEAVGALKRGLSRFTNRKV